MNTQTVTVQTARKLAAAGFPQPAPAPGQWWGAGTGFVYVYGEKKGMYTPVIRHAPGVRPVIDDYFDDLDFGGLVYLPTVGDILRELPQFCILERWDGDGLFYLESANGYDQFKHESAAEATALAYLELNEKNT